MKKFYVIIISFTVLIAAFAAVLVWQRNQASESGKISIPKNEEIVPANIQGATVNLVAVGDIMLSRNVAAKMREKGADYPFDAVKDMLKSGDITFANLESPITPGPKVPTGSMIFHADPGAEEALKSAGIIIVSLANNHTPNYGQKGLLDTFKFLNGVGIKYVGAGKNEQEAASPQYIELKGIKIAFLAYNDTDVVPQEYGASATRAGTNLMDIPKMEEAVKAAKQNADLVIVSMHSGTEYKLPNQKQKDFAHAAIDAGADLIIGHHPHVLQPIENYKGKYIMYSLGNFVFDQMFSAETRESVIAKISLSKEGVSGLEFVPVMIYDYSQPRPVIDPAEREKIFTELGIDKSGTVEARP